MSTAGDSDRLPAEARARTLIDQQLTSAGWQVQDRKDLNLFAGQGIAVREVVMKPGHGRVDYLLYVDRADGRLPFVFEASGVETHFTNGFDPQPRARLIFTVPRPRFASCRR